jgi:hypothetical protein
LIFGVLAALCAVADIAHYAWNAQTPTLYDTELPYQLIRQLGNSNNPQVMVFVFVFGFSTFSLGVE